MMQPDQQAAYMQWVNAGATGSPPAWVFEDRDQQAKQQASAQAAVAAVQKSGLGNAFDLGGTGYSPQALQPTPGLLPVSPGLSPEEMQMKARAADAQTQALSLQSPAVTAGGITANQFAPPRSPGGPAAADNQMPPYGMPPAQAQLPSMSPGAPQLGTPPIQASINQSSGTTTGGSITGQAQGYPGGNGIGAGVGGMNMLNVGYGQGTARPGTFSTGSGFGGGMNIGGGSATYQRGPGPVGSAPGSPPSSSFGMWAGRPAQTQPPSMPPSGPPSSGLWAGLPSQPKIPFGDSNPMPVGKPETDPAPTQNGTTTGFGNPGFGYNASTQPIGNGAFDALQKLYHQQVPGWQANDAADPNAFNNWTGGVMKQFGASDWESLPSDFLNRYNATGGSPLPGGVVSNPFGGVSNTATTTGTDGTRSLGGELGAIGQYLGPFTQSGYNNAAQFSPLYTGLNVGNFGTTLNTISGGLSNAYNAANPNIANFNGVLGNTLSSVAANRPTGATATGYDPTTAAQSLRFQNVNGQSVSPSTTFNGVNAPGQDMGLQYGYGLLGINGAGGGGSLQQQLEQQAREGLSLGSSLSPEEQRNAQQSAREAWSARGLVNSPGASADEVLNRYNAGQQRLQQRQQFAQGVEQQGLQSALGLSGAAQGYAGLGLQAQQANLGAQLTGNNLNFQGQIANQGNSLQSQLANQQARLQTNQLGSNIGMFNANQLNQGGQFNAGAANNMGQFNQGLNFAGNQANWTNALQYGNLLGNQAINPFSYALALQGQSPDYTGNLLGYGGDLFNTNYNAARAAAIAKGNNSASLLGAGLGALGSLGAAGIRNGWFGGSDGGGDDGGDDYYDKGYADYTDLYCIPLGELVDTPSGPVAIEALHAGDTVIGYDGTPVPVIRIMRYNESRSTRYYRFTLDNGSRFAVSESHRITGTLSQDINLGHVIDGKTVVSIIEFNGVEKSHDLITTDQGYRMSGVPVNTMVFEMAGIDREQLTTH